MSSDHKDEKEHKSGGGHGGGGSHGGGGHEEHHEGAPEWIISYADNVTLLMGFFVILMAMNLKPASGGAGGDSKEPGNPPPTPETLDFALAVREAFHNPVDPNSTSAVDLPLIQRLIERSGDSKAEQDGRMGREHDVRSIRKSAYFSPAGSIPFDDGAAVLSEEGREVLRQMQKIVRGHNLVIDIRGHVSAAEAFEQVDRGMHLSYQRALGVAEALVAEGMPWTQLRLIACGDGERITPVAYEPASHRSNQRAEIIVTDHVARPTGGDENAPPSPAPSDGTP